MKKKATQKKPVNKPQKKPDVLTRLANETSTFRRNKKLY